MSCRTSGRDATSCVCPCSRLGLPRRGDASRSASAAANSTAAGHACPLAAKWRSTAARSLPVCLVFTRLICLFQLLGAQTRKPQQCRATSFTWPAQGIEHRQLFGIHPHRHWGRAGLVVASLSGSLCLCVHHTLSGLSLRKSSALAQPVGGVASLTPRMARIAILISCLTWRCQPQ